MLGKIASAPIESGQHLAEIRPGCRGRDQVREKPFQHPRLRLAQGV